MRRRCPLVRLGFAGSNRDIVEGTVPEVAETEDTHDDEDSIIEGEVQLSKDIFEGCKLSRIKLPDSLLVLKSIGEAVSFVFSKQDFRFPNDDIGARAKPLKKIPWKI